MHWKNFRFSSSNFSRFVSRLIREVVSGDLHHILRKMLCFVRALFRVTQFMYVLYAGIGMLLNYNCNVNVAIFCYFHYLLNSVKRVVSKQRESLN